jgi:hypothetical protein
VLLYDHSVDGKPIQIAGRTFDHGVSTHARSDLAYLLGGAYSRFRSWVGLDVVPSTRFKEPTARFLVYGDGVRLFDSGLMKRDTPAMRVDVDVTNVNVLRLIITYLEAYAEHANWAEAELVTDPGYRPASTSRPAEPRRNVRSDGLTFVTAGNLLHGLDLQNGQHINLRGSFALGPYSPPAENEDTVRESANFRSTPGGVAWEWECISKSHRPWTAAIDTVFHWPNATRAKLWLPRGFGSKWQDPLVPQLFEDKTFEYGAFFNREDELSLPMVTVIDEENKVGVTFIQSPSDVLLSMQISTSKDGEVRFSRAFHRLGGEPHKTKFHMDIVVHEPDFRAGLQAIVERYPEYFEPPVPLAHTIAGGGAYSSWEGVIDAKKLAAMGFTVNWKASFDFPYMGMFLPPVGDDERWNRFPGDSDGVFNAQDEGAKAQTSIRQMNEYAVDLRTKGFFVLSYFNVTEFGAHISYPMPPADTDHATPVWKDSNRFLHAKLEDAVLKTPEPIWTWAKAVIMDCGDPAYRDFLMEQAKRHIEKLPASSGIAIDRMDWLTRYNPNADDGETWIDGPNRHLRRSWIALMESMGPLFRNHGKVIFANDMDRRLELMRHVDGIWDEHGYYPFNLNTSSFLALRKPLICWTLDEKPMGDDPDEYLQRHLYMGAFPMVPYPENDHSIRPDETHERFYLDYGHMFNAMRGRTWVLKPAAITVNDGAAKANLFETPRGYIMFVGFGGDQAIAQVRLRLPIGSGRILHPGQASETIPRGTSQDEATVFDVPLRRGCAMLLFEKKQS